jgi:glycosyltransferase involved in cell wall biosynthesis
MKNKNGVSIIIPVFNERDGIESTLQHLKQIMSNANFENEIIIVNDGSNDGTEEILKKLNKDDFTVINHEINSGYGAAIKTGIIASNFDCIALTDADGTYPNIIIPELVKICYDENYDMVVGARVAKNVKIPLIRKPAKWVITKLANYLSGTRIPDVNSGLRVMKKSIVNKFANILPNGFSFTTTITLAMLTNNHSVKYIPIDYFFRKGKSKIRPIYDTLNFLQLIIRTILYFNPIKVFIPLSLFLIMLAFIVLAGSWLFLERVMDVGFGVILMAAVMVMAIGLLADLIDKRLGG